MLDLPSHRAMTKPGTVPRVEEEAAMPTNPLIGPDELAAAIQSPRAAPLLLDVRWQLGGPPGLEAYLTGHLPGAVFVDLDRELAAPPGPGGRHPLPDPVAFQAATRRWGVRGDRAVVVYDQRDTTSAARAWWLLGYHGHPDVRVLDGGYDGWVARGLPVASEVRDPEPGDFQALPGQRPLLDADGAAEVARAGVLLDARAAARFRGEQEPVDPVAGRIPGARSAPAADNVTAAGSLRPAGELRARFDALGVRDGVPVGAYCGSGVVAAHLVLALELAGHRAGLYAGSWSEWITDPSRPVATGEE
jgi:thiosulfate/3-mercaptopyruvate sulfurtransferase